MTSEDRMETKESKSDNLLQVDPLSKPKKLAVAVFVIGMVAVMVLAFAAFHWLYTEYFNFTATKAERMQELSGIKVRCAEKERESQERILAAADEFSRKQTANEESFKKRNRELEEELTRKKQDFATLIKGFKERFDATTNELAGTIQIQNTELQRLMKEKESLADMSRQYESISNALVRARDERDKVMRLAREAQDTFNEWNGKIGAAKSELSRIETEKVSLQNELQKLESSTNNAALFLSALRNEEKIGRGRLVALAAELQTASNALTTANATLSDIRTDIVTKTSERKIAETARNDAAKAQKDAEKKRDNAQGEYEVAENKLEQMRGELEKMANATNNAVIKLEQIKGAIEVQKATMQSARIELQSISNKIELANMRLTEIARQTETVEREQKRIASETAQCEKDKNEALDSKREAESLRDKAVSEKELAEKRLKERKPEIEAQIAEMEKRLSALKKEVSKAEQKKADGDQTKGETK